MYDAKGWFFPKRVTFIIDREGMIFHIIRNVNVHTHGGDILETITDLLE
jgi:peroxiredoxin